MVKLWKMSCRARTVILLLAEPCFDHPALGRMFFLTFYVFGSCLKMLAVILVSDFFFLEVAWEFYFVFQDTSFLYGLGLVYFHFNSFRWWVLCVLSSAALSQCLLSVCWICCTFQLHLPPSTSPFYDLFLILYSLAHPPTTHTHTHTFPLLP